MIYSINESIGTGLHFKSASVSGHESEYEEFKKLTQTIFDKSNNNGSFKKIECKKLDDNKVRNLYEISCYLQNKIYDNSRTLSIPKEFNEFFNNLFTSLGMKKGKRQGESRFPMFYKKSSDGKYYYALFVEVFPGSLGQATRAGAYAGPYAPDRIDGFRIVLRICEDNKKNAKFIGFKHSDKNESCGIFEQVEFV